MRHRLARRLRRAAGASLILAALASAGQAQLFGVAGSPVGSIRDRNYARLFGTLKANGIDLYLPTFQFEEVPAPRTLGYETDFTAPCSPDDPAFVALRASGLKLILPGDLIYPDPAGLRATSTGTGTGGDPLAAAIACAGRAQVAAITVYDEAVLNRVPLSTVRAFHDKVASIDATLPVLMVHAPIVLDKPAFDSLPKIERYLAEVREYSRFADYVGFDVYPTPADIAKIASPLSGGAQVDSSRAVRDYAQWLNAAVPDRRTLMVLQGFSYTDLYSEAFLAANVPSELRARIKAPVAAELETMVGHALDAGIDMILWWGPAALDSEATAPWPDILSIARRHGR